MPRYKLFESADYYLQEKNSWIVDCEIKTIRTVVLTMKINRMRCLFAKTEFSHFSVDKLCLNSRPLVTLTSMLSAFLTQRLKFTFTDF